MLQPELLYDLYIEHTCGLLDIDQILHSSEGCIQIFTNRFLFIFSRLGFHPFSFYISSAEGNNKYYFLVKQVSQS